jgi:hypothetical protein
VPLPADPEEAVIPSHSTSKNSAEDPASGQDPEPPVEQPSDGTLKLYWIFSNIIQIVRLSCVPLPGKPATSSPSLDDPAPRQDIDPEPQLGKPFQSDGNPSLKKAFLQNSLS